MEAQPQAPEPKKSNKMLFIIVGVLLACCILVIIVGLVYQFVISPSISNTIDAISSTPQGNEASPGSSTSSDLPSGGNTSDILRRDVWMAISGVSSGSGCTPDVAQTTIEITQGPDSSGIWIEKWTVACSSGEQQAFDVTFTPTAGGGTDYSITTSP
jgi:hypothetical protein